MSDACLGNVIERDFFRARWTMWFNVLCGLRPRFAVWFKVAPQVERYYWPDWYEPSLCPLCTTVNSYILFFLDSCMSFYLLVSCIVCILKFYLSSLEQTHWWMAKHIRNTIIIITVCLLLCLFLLRCHRYIFRVAIYMSLNLKLTHNVVRHVH